MTVQHHEAAQLLLSVLDFFAGIAGWLVPGREDRYTHSLSSLIITTTLPNLLLILHAHLFLRYPHNRLPRLLLMPIIVVTALRCAFAGRINPGTLNQYNFMTYVAAIYTMARAVIWAFHTKAPRWTGNEHHVSVHAEAAIVHKCCVVTLSALGDFV